MRDIKYRIWLENEEFMGEVVQITRVKDNIVEIKVKDTINGGWYYVYEDSKFSLMQYTGLKDINGVEIYEGDIVAKNLGNELGYVAFLPQEMGYVIVYKNCDERLGNRNTGSQYEYDSRLAKLGNIYENPELIKE